MSEERPDRAKSKGATLLDVLAFARYTPVTCRLLDRERRCEKVQGASQKTRRRRCRPAELSSSSQVAGLVKGKFGVPKEDHLTSPTSSVAQLRKRTISWLAMMAPAVMPTSRTVACSQQQFEV